MKKLIGIYDLQDSERCCGIYDTLEEASKALGVSVNTIYSRIQRGLNLVFNGRYKLVLVNVDEEEKGE